jgi:hypothetical protein
MAAPGVVLLVTVVLIVLALAYYLVSTILALARIARGLDATITAVGGIVEKTAPVGEVVDTINANLDAGVAALEALLVQKAGMPDALGLVDGIYPGAAASGFRAFPDSGDTKAPRIAEIYTRGVLSLARLGREAPIAAASHDGPVLRDVQGGAHAAMDLYPDVRHTRPQKLPRSPLIGAGAPVQYEPTLSPGVRRQPPGQAALLDPEGRPDADSSAV